MAEAVVAMVAEGIKPLGDYIIQEAKFLGGVSDQVELAQTELQMMLGYLKDADARQGEEVVRAWVAAIREVAYDLEDVIETFVLKVIFKRRESFLKRFTGIFKRGVNLHEIGSEIESITTKISKLRSSLQSYNIQEIRESGAATSFERQQDRRLAYPHVVEPHVVGIEDATTYLVTKLIKEKCHRVVSIWGMGGLGKTTLAKQVYNHNEVKRHFDCFAWVCISQRCQGREVLEEILIKLTSANNEQRKEIGKMKKDEIAERLCATQQERKCLVVLDDIWARDAWRSLEAGFPMNVETESRILLTTRNKEVASCADNNGFLYNPESLNDDQSWELFEKIAMFGIKDTADPKIYAKKKELGKKMLERCVGLPLAITVLAGLLSRKDTIDEWDAVHKNLYAYIRRGTDLGPEYKGEEYEGVSWVLALSYDNLPYRLKLCFLYLAHFPEDYEIPVKILTKLWMAEGFVSPVYGEIMEDVSYSCLSELVDRCMVQVGIHGSTKKIKTCRLHDLMRDLCMLKAKGGNFLHIINFSAARATREVPIGRVRRLAIYLDQRLEEYAPATDERDGHLRSLSYFMPPPEYRFKTVHKKLLQLKDFKFLRVLKFEGVQFVQLRSEIGNLVHLRFLSLQHCLLKELPSSVANLVRLQTLDLRVLSTYRIKIPNVFWKMEQLRHLYLPSHYRLRQKLSSFATAGNLQTVVNHIMKASDLYDLAKVTSLRKLKVDIYEGEIEKREGITFNHLQSLSMNSKTEVMPWNMVLSCPNIYKLRLNVGGMTELPAELMFFQNLTKITLLRIYLSNDHIRILEKLPNLRILSVENPLGFFYSQSNVPETTPVWSRRGFPNLEYLSIVNLPGLKDWRVERGAMPRLRILLIGDCNDLTALPEGLQYISTLKELNIVMPDEFCSRLEQGGEDFYKIQHVPVKKITSSTI